MTLLETKMPASEPGEAAGGEGRGTAATGAELLLLPPALVAETA